VKNAQAEALLPGFDFEAVVGGRLRRAAARTRPGASLAVPRCVHPSHACVSHAALARAVVLLVVDLADFDGSFPAVAARVLSSIGDALHVVRHAFSPLCGCLCLIS
jgi:hypothetical protein